MRLRRNKTAPVWRLKNIIIPAHFVIAEMEPDEFNRFAETYELVKYRVDDRILVLDPENEVVFWTKAEEADGVTLRHGGVTP